MNTYERIAITIAHSGVDLMDPLAVKLVLMEAGYDAADIMEHRYCAAMVAGAIRRAGNVPDGLALHYRENREIIAQIDAALARRADEGSAGLDRPRDAASTGSARR